MDIVTVQKAISPFKDILKSIFKGGKDEFTNFFEIGLTEYIEDRNEKFGITNTFIKRNEKVNFYDIYFPLSLSSRGNSPKKIDSDDILEKLFQDGNCAAILGMAGSGKTMLMRHSFLQCYNRTFKIPLYIELRDLNSLGVSLLEYIYSIILKNRVKPSTKILERALEQGGFLFLFDGYDEISYQIKEKVTLEIEQFIDQFNKNFFLVSSRPGANLEGLPRFYSYYVDPLKAQQIDAFIEKQLVHSDESELIGKLKSAVKRDANREYSEYLSNPLLLSMFILTFRNYPELPRLKSKFYWNVFDTLCTKHDSITKKGGFVHAKKSSLQNEDFEKILKWFCYISILESRFNFDEQYLSEKLKYVREVLGYTFDIKDIIYDLTVSISILVVEGLEYKFPHRTIQDYFMVLFIKDQDEESKKIIYSEKFKAILPYAPNKNLFDLCVEIDKQAYYKYYLIRLLTEFSNFFNAPTILENAIRLLKRLDQKYRISVENDSIEPRGAERMVIDFIDICQLYNLRLDFSISLGGPISRHKLILELIEEKKLIKSENPYQKESFIYTISMLSLSDEDVKKVILEYYKIQDFESFFERMKNFSNQISEEFRKDSQNNIALIDFKFK